MTFRFDEYEVDTAAFELRRGHEVVPVEPQVFEVLAHLVRHRDRVVSKEELLDEIWGSRFVSESALTSRVKSARRAIGDSGTAQRSIRTVHGRGYRFVAPVEELSEERTAERAAVGEPTATPRLEASGPIRYTRSDELNIAYQVTGAGDLDLVLVAGFVSHLMLDWTEPRHAHFLGRLGRFSRLIRFDKRGTGMSDRPGGLPDLETRMRDVAAVMDAARSPRAVLFGYSEGGPMSILFAATHPERVAGLVLYSTYARRLWSPEYPWGSRPEDRARYAEQLEREWGFEADMHLMCPNADDDLARWWGERCRAATSPGAARALIEMNSLIDVTPVLGAVQAPTLVLHRRHDIDSKVDEGRFLVERIPGARFVELEGADHFVAVDPDQILDPVEEFVRSLPASGTSEASLTTLLAVRVDAAVDPALVRGVVLDAVEAQRGLAAVADEPAIVATFDGPGRAVRAALDAVGRLDAAGLGGRAGLHVAEVTRHGAQVCGDGTTVAGLVASQAAPGEVWVTSAVRDLVAGSGLTFLPRGELAGPPGARTWELAAAGG